MAHNSFLLLCCRNAMDHPFRFWARAAGTSPIGMGIRGSIYLRTVDCRRLCMLGVWHAARQYGDACIGLVCDADTIHRIRNGAAWRCTRCAILGWCDTRGGRLVDQCVDRQTCHQTHRLSVRFPRIGHSKCSPFCVLVRFWRICHSACSSIDLADCFSRIGQAYGAITR